MNADVWAQASSMSPHSEAHVSGYRTISEQKGVHISSTI